MDNRPELEVMGLEFEEEKKRDSKGAIVIHTKGTGRASFLKAVL